MYERERERERVCWLTKSFEKLSSGKLSIKEQSVIDGVVGPTHTDQKNIHTTCEHHTHTHTVRHTNLRSKFTFKQLLILGIKKKNLFRSLRFFRGLCFDEVVVYKLLKMLITRELSSVQLMIYNHVDSANCH